MEMQSHEVSGGNAKSPDASNTRPLMQSTLAQGSVIDPHGSEGTSQFQPNPRPTESLLWSPGAGISQMDSRLTATFQQPTANLLAPASQGHFGQHRSLSAEEAIQSVEKLGRAQLAALATALWREVLAIFSPVPAVQNGESRA